MDNAADFLRRGAAAYKDGKTREAQSLFIRALKLDEANSLAWLWLSGVADSKEQKQHCLQKVLELDPHNSTAQKLLKNLNPQAVFARDEQEIPSALPAATPENYLVQSRRIIKKENEKVTDLMLIVGIAVLVVALTAVIILFYQSFNQPTGVVGANTILAFVNG